jgi:metal-responsive CopG/Arc/MetJ family transcriptional regulator
MPRETVVIPATRIPRRLWLILEEVMRTKMFTSKAELIKDALREYAVRHKEEVGRAQFDLIDALIVLEEGRAEDARREEELLEWAEKLRPRQ